MADIEGEPEDDDPLEAGVPVIDSRVRVWNPGDVDKPPAPDEYTRMGLVPPSPAAAEAMAKIAAKKERDLELADRPDPRIAFLTALVAKFPEFDTGWPEATMTKWFTGFERILEAGLK